MPRVPLHIPLPGRDPCPYCQMTVELYPSSEDVYGGKDYGPIWLCTFCGARVGCHPGTNKALGRVANKELREWKMKAHKALDPLWQWKIVHQGCRKGPARGKAYKWLAEQMGIDKQECHIGYFTVEQCKQVVDLCNPIKKRLKWRNANDLE